jgi:hypothetical protein
MLEVGRLQVRQHRKQCPRAADRVCQREPVGKMELSNHGKGLMQSRCRHGEQNILLDVYSGRCLLSFTDFATDFPLISSKLAGAGHQVWIIFPVLGLMGDDTDFMGLIQ